MATPTLRPRSSRRAAWLLVLAIAGGAAGASASPPRRLPGPAPQGRAAGTDPREENRACEACHEDEAREWRGSLHQRSWDDPVFLASYAVEPTAFCRKCHAPETDPTGVPEEGARRLGVGCVTCHVSGGEVTGPRERKGGAHPVRGDARLAGEGACAGCHEFDFPTAAPTSNGAPMQGTVSEHQASAHASESCQKCHMAKVRGEGGKLHKSHDFKVVGDVAMLRSAVKAKAARTTEREVTVTLAAQNVGHDFPTGDLYRRLEVRARGSGAGSAARSATLGRRFSMVRSATGLTRVPVGDDRLPGSGAPREVRLRFDEPIDARELRWEVVYQRMDPGLARVLGVDPAKDDVVVAEGVLPPLPSLRRGPEGR